MRIQICVRHLVVLPIGLILVACSSDIAEVSEPEPSRIEVLADEFLAATLQRYPTMATYISIEGARHDRLFDNSLEALAEYQAKEDAWLAELNAIGSPEEIGSRDWVSYGTMYEELESSVGTRVCRNELWQASSTTAWYRSLPFVFDIQPVETPELRQQTLDRLGEVARYIDGEIANLRLGIEMGYSAPQVTVTVVPEQTRALVSDDSIFMSPAKRADDEKFAAAVKEIYEDQIVPAIHRYADFIEDDYLPNSRDGIALSENPNGGECYRARVRSFVTLQMPADEIHQIGLEQIAGIRTEFRSIIDEHYGGGPIEEFLRRINFDPQFTFKSEEEVVQLSIDAVDAAREAMSRAFGRLPKADVLVKPYPDFAKSGVGEYHSSSEDGSRPGIYYVATSDPTHRGRATTKSTLYHETFPGHHHQGAIALELGDSVHSIARYFWNSGYGEGWALYSERLADELGLYHEPLDYVGLLSDQGARAARLVIDTGLHTKGWTRQQAVDYMMSNTSWAEVDIENDINRYISWPGQANAYMLGMLEIRRLRNLAEQELGDDFNLSAFHDRVVGFGSITLPMLHVSILAWIEEQRTHD